MKRELYKQKLINSYGTLFEDKVCELLLQVYGDKFQRVATYGNIGDRKNDGFIKSEGIFYQINGPVENTISSQQQANRKLTEDFKKLKEYCDNGIWTKINKFYFVYNDKAQGINPELYERAKTIANDNNIECEVLGIDYLMNLFYSLDERKQDILTERYEVKKDVDIDVYLDLKEKFYDSGIFYKLIDFHIGMIIDTNYFNIPYNFKNSEDNLGDSDTYLYYILSDPFSSFRNSKYEKLRIKFCNRFMEFLDGLGSIYFPLENQPTKIKLINNIPEKKKEEVREIQGELVRSLDEFFREHYKEYGF